MVAYISVKFDNFASPLGNSPVRPFDDRTLKREHHDVMCGLNILIYVRLSSQYVCPTDLQFFQIN